MNILTNGILDNPIPETKNMERVICGIWKLGENSIDKS